MILESMGKLGPRAYSGKIPGVTHPCPTSIGGVLPCDANCSSSCAPMMAVRKP
jgi:hypothetical protein